MRKLRSIKKANQLGLSLVELMVAMVLGLLLIAGVLQVFLGNRQAQRTEQAVSRIEENGRIAMDLIAQDLRSAGYYGCSRSIKNEISAPGQTLFTNLVKTTVLTVPISSNFVDNSVRGFQQSIGGVWTPALTSDLTTSLSAISGRPGSDAIAIYFGQPTGMTLTAAVSGTSNIALNTNGACINTGDQVLIGNCAATDLIAVTSASACSGTTTTLQHSTASNTSASLTATSANPYGTNSKVSKFFEHVYFVKDSGRKAPDGTRIYSLYRRESSGAAPQELVEGIEFLHILYGELLASGNIRYVSANTSGLQWKNIVSVQIGLLTQSYDSVRTDSDTTSYTLLDQPIAATGTPITHSGGRSLRRVYTATVELRNRLE